MSEAVPRREGPEPRSYASAGIAGALVPLALAVFINFGPAIVEESATWLERSTFVFNAFAFGGLIAFPAALVLVGIMSLVEHRRARPLWFWMGLGLAVASPAALLAWIATRTIECVSECQPPGLKSAMPTLTIYGCAAVGAAVAWWVRNGSRRA
jgi:hypothetical protein